MLTIDQLERLREVCVMASGNAAILALGVSEVIKVELKKDYEQATAALADIDAEIELLKGLK